MRSPSSTRSPSTAAAAAAPPSPSTSAAAATATQTSAAGSSAPSTALGAYDPLTMATAVSRMIKSTPEDVRRKDKALMAKVLVKNQANEEGKDFNEVSECEYMLRIFYYLFIFCFFSSIY